MTSAILHVGFSKCGSSALQTVLSEHPSLGSRDAPLEYVVLRHNGLLCGPELIRATQFAPYGYLTSIRAKQIATWSALRLRRLARQIEELAGPEGRVILSREGWTYEYDIFKQAQWLKALRLQCEVVMYVRPPADWLNSAWWQWGAWSGVPFHRWLNRNIKNNVCWAERIEPWRHLAGVEKVTVRLLPKDVVGDFCELLGLPALESNRSNTSLPAEVLRLYQRHRDLRPGPHDSTIDFSLARNLRQLGGRTPWVLGPKMLEKIMVETRDSNRKLLEFLDPEDRARMEADPRWWDPSAYSDRRKQRPGELPVRDGALDSLAAEALRALYKLDGENRQLREKLASVRGGTFEPTETDRGGRKTLKSLQVISDWISGPVRRGEPGSNPAPSAVTGKNDQRKQ